MIYLTALITAYEVRFGRRLCTGYDTMENVCKIMSFLFCIHIYANNSLSICQHLEDVKLLLTALVKELPSEPA
jgi:hypothetical protein